jgi:uncharacterized protein (DUF924 family)
VQAKDILSFWFNELSPKQQFAKDAKLDALMRRRFSDVHHVAARG